VKSLTTNPTQDMKFRTTTDFGYIGLKATIFNNMAFSPTQIMKRLLLPVAHYNNIIILHPLLTVCKTWWLHSKKDMGMRKMCKSNSMGAISQKIVS